MSRTATRTKPAPSTPSKSEAPAKPVESHRETLESVVVAFILALLIRGFEAEAFVIPTGSMAPTLMGRHKEITCPECGHVYSVNASDESEAGMRASQRWVEYGTCVNCRYQARIDEAPSFKGDRILVMKFIYDLTFLPGASAPRRWDVVVFKYPEDPETNYIKRLIGLPDEEVRVFHGDIHTRPRDSRPDAPFHLERKPLYHQDAMQITVYDDAHRAKALAHDPRWLRWRSRAAGAWTEGPDGTFTNSDAASRDWSELRYHHVVPDPEQWRSLLVGGASARPPRESLVTDFYSYNSNVTADSSGGEGGWMQQPHWVGDLTLSCRLEATAPTGQVRLELIEGGVANHCEIDLATGQATLKRGDKTLGTASTYAKGAGTHDLAFANVDDRLTLWVDGRTPFGAGVEYDDGPSAPLPSPTTADLAPAAVAVRGASARVSGLVLKRDIYYTQTPGKADYTVPWDGFSADPTERAQKYFDLLADPSRYASLVTDEPRDYPIKPGRYMMMGDNSPRSKDGRGWGHRDKQWDDSDREDWEVPQSLLIGKAFFVYWPHGKPFGPDIRISRDFRIPFRPYFERMKWIR